MSLFKMTPEQIEEFELDSRYFVKDVSGNPMWQSELVDFLIFDIYRKTYKKVQVLYLPPTSTNKQTNKQEVQHD